MASLLLLEAPISSSPSFSANPPSFLLLAASTIHSIAKRLLCLSSKGLGCKSILFLSFLFFSPTIGCTLLMAFSTVVNSSWLLFFCTTSIADIIKFNALCFFPSFINKFVN
eukprot:NODE_682_length_5232_cov_0.148646.p5 type:complete len:111 gc:universal NODE_682_length_5232_cov_0.148646:1343-1675(+)